MAKDLPRYRDYDDRRRYEDHEPYYPPRRPTAGNGPAWVMAGLMFIGLVAFIGYLLIGLYPKADATVRPTQTRIGNQAPPNVVRRGSVEANPNVAGNEATAQVMYEAAVNGQQTQPTLPPLPLNSQGQPIISVEQQRQQALSLQLAEQEGNAAADQALQAQRATAYADAQSRAPDISAQDGATMMGRPLCSVPRADPHTCEQGLYKPTPVN